MKKYSFLVFGLCAAMLFTGCKSQESAYKQAYEKAKAQELAQGDAQNTTTTPVTTVTTPVEGNTTVEVTPVARETVTEADNSDVRTIQGGLTVVKGSPLRPYSVVVGSFVTQANAEGLAKRLEGNGYAARVVKTNETINGHTGWFRVIASSFDDKASAAQSRDGLREGYPGAWLLYHK